MKFILSLRQKINKNFNHQNFDRITDIIKVNFFQFRPKYSSMLNKLKFVESYYNKIREICKKRKLK